MHNLNIAHVTRTVLIQHTYTVPNDLYTAQPWRCGAWSAASARQAPVQRKEEQRAAVVFRRARRPKIKTLPFPIHPILYSSFSSDRGDAAGMEGVNARERVYPGSDALGATSVLAEGTAQHWPDGPAVPHQVRALTRVEPRLPLPFLAMPCDRHVLTAATGEDEGW